MIINDIKNGISISKTQKRNFYFSKTERFAIQGSGEAMEEGFCVKGNRGEGDRFWDIPFNPALIGDKTDIPW